MISAQKKADGKSQADPPSAGKALGLGYIDAMIASPNSEHLISVAPCIWRAKS